ncbi:MAG: SWIM zinc finger family protein [Halobacteriaceae archaeon]
MGCPIEDPRIGRALAEDMDIQFHERGPVCRVKGTSGTIYTVDIDAGTCTCPDFQHRGDRLDQGCKHLRRVDLEIRAGEVPGPDGTFRR